MQVCFEATLDELVDVNVRSLEHSGTWNKLRNRTTIFTGFFVALLVFAILTVLDWLFRRIHRRAIVDRAIEHLRAVQVQIRRQIRYKSAQADSLRATRFIEFTPC